MQSCRLASAKINLALHVTGKRDDGYHLLDSLVGFAAFGDQLCIDGQGGGLRLSGPFGDALDGEDDNLIMQAARLMGQATGKPIEQFGFALEKNLPVASGIGGGSADAAAALRLVNEVWGHPLSEPQLCALGLQLGADVPVCVKAVPTRMRGIGEVLDRAHLPECGLVLVNPLQPVPTSGIFKALDGHYGHGLPDLPTRFATFAELTDWLAGTRNDLEAPAIEFCPPIGEIKAALQADSECALARMSGSGATVFGLCKTEGTARRVAGRLNAERHGWWAVATRMMGGG